MKLNYQQLETHLNKGLSPIYLIAGTEYLLVQETIEAIKASAKGQGYDEFISLSADAGIDWQLLQAETDNFSLFSQKQFISLKLGNHKLSEEGKSCLSAYVNKQMLDKILVITVEKLDAALQNQTWFKTLDKSGVIIQLWPISFQELPQWIHLRLKKAGLSAEPAAIQLLAQRTEGNLLASAQEINKLSLLYPGCELTAAQVLDSSANSAHYDVFDLTDTMLQGQLQRCLIILDVLRQEGMEAAIILWAITREIRQLALMQDEVNAGHTLAQVFNKHKVWEKRKAWLTKWLRLHSLADFQSLLKHAACIDEIIKGIQSGNCWDGMRALIIRFHNIPFLTPTTTP